MLSRPASEIDHRTIKLIVGLIALSLASLTSFLARFSVPTRITSISESYYAAGWAQNIFVGFLFAISAFMLAYNGYSKLQMVLSKIAAVAALCIALFPCKCDIHKEIIPGVHGVSAAVMFVVLAGFCYIWYRRALNKQTTHANRRAVIYLLCFIAIVVSILTLALDHYLHGAIKSRIGRLTFYGERTGLVAFGVSWLTASHRLLVIASKAERFAARNPQASKDDPDFKATEFSA